MFCKKFETFKRLPHDIKNINAFMGMITIKLKAIAAFRKGGLGVDPWRVHRGLHLSPKFYFLSWVVGAQIIISISSNFFSRMLEMFH